MSSPSAEPPVAAPIVSAGISARAQLAASKLNINGQPTKFQALRAFGWILPFDYLMATFIGLTWVTVGFYFLFGHPTVLRLMAFAIVDFFIFQVWIVSLVFRCSCFVLETQADINLMPEAAAKIAVAFLKGQRPSSK